MKCLFCYKRQFRSTWCDFRVSDSIYNVETQYVEGTQTECWVRREKAGDEEVGSVEFIATTRKSCTFLWRRWSSLIVICFHPFTSSIILPRFFVSGNIVREYSYKRLRNVIILFAILFAIRRQEFLTTH